MNNVLDIVHIDYERIRPSEYKGFTEIGRSFDEDAILLDRSDGRVIVVGAGETPDEGFADASIYHYLLFAIISSRE